MKIVKVSLRSIMEDDNHPLMNRWVDAIQPQLDKIIEKSLKENKKDSK